MVGLPEPAGRRRFIGVDQTGAALRGGRSAKPLPWVSLAWDGAWTLSAATSAGPRLADALTPAAFGGVDGDTAVIVDAVLGLPASAWPRTGEAPGGAGLRALWGQAAAWPDGFGRAAAMAFLGRFDPGDDGLRAHDRRAGALSVFRGVPFQRQVAAGTYRVWRDLGAHGGDWAWVWGLDAPDPSRAVLAEGWPSLGWRRVLGQPVRRPEALPDLLAAAGVRCDGASAAVLVASPDHADAAAAALLGAWTQAHRGWTGPEGAAPGEGGLLGLDVDAPPIVR